MKLPSPALSFRSSGPVRKFVENLIIRVMDVSNITRQISALRAQIAPNSITPESLGSILQSITNLISSLSNIDTGTETNLISRVEALEGDMQTAMGKATAAATTAGNMLIDTFALGEDNVTITVQQHGYSAMTLTLVPATTTKAGIMSAEDKDHLDKAYQRNMASLSCSSTETQVKLNYKRHNDQVTTVILEGASSSAAGLMTAADKVKLDSLGTEYETIQQVQQQVLSIADGFAPLNMSKIHIIPIFEGFMMLDSMGQNLDTVDGATYDFTGAQDKCWYNPSTKKIMYWWSNSVGASRYEPSYFPGIFFNKVTGRCYRWNNTMQEMQEWLTNLM